MQSSDWDVCVQSEAKHKSTLIKKRKALAYLKVYIVRLM